MRPRHPEPPPGEAPAARRRRAGSRDPNAAALPASSLSISSFPSSLVLSLIFLSLHCPVAGTAAGARPRPTPVPWPHRQSWEPSPPAGSDAQPPRCCAAITPATDHPALHLFFVGETTNSSSSVDRAPAFVGCIHGRSITASCTPPGVGLIFISFIHM